MARQLDFSDPGRETLGPVWADHGRHGHWRGGPFLNSEIFKSSIIAIVFPGSDSATWKAPCTLLHGLLIGALIAAVGWQLASSQVHSQNCTTWCFPTIIGLQMKHFIISSSQQGHIVTFCDWTSVDSLLEGWTILAFIAVELNHAPWIVIVNQDSRDCPHN